MQTYGACYGVAINPQVINVAGGPPANADAGESELDIEVVAGMAPRANIQVYQGPPGQAVAIDNAIVAADQAKVISSSWGACESITGGATINAENTILQEAAAQGQSFFISSGDSGSAMCAQATGGQQTQLSVIDPGGQPFATGVGGTNIYTPSGTSASYYQPGDPVYQSVWNAGVDNGRASGSGGGLSSVFTMPIYQSAAPAAVGVINSESSAAPCGGSANCREVPDVSADADPNTGYAVYTDGQGGAQWSSVGGTSAAAPLWASFVALANATPTCRGLSLGFVNPSLYGIAGAAYNADFSDITSGSIFSGVDSNDPYADQNNSPIQDPDGDMFKVRTGYDMATGLGSMIAGPLAQSLCAARAPVYSVAVANPGTVAATIGTPVALQIHATDSGGAPLSYSVNGLSAGLTMSGTTGLISGVPTTAGTATVNVAAGDPYTNLGSTQFVIAVAAAPVVKTTSKPSGKPTLGSVAIVGLTRRRPKLSFAVRGGDAKLKTLAVTLPKGFSYAGRSRLLARGITIKAGHKKLTFRAKVKKRVLVITPAQAGSEGDGDAHRADDCDQPQGGRADQAQEGQEACDHDLGDERRAQERPARPSR